jgi:hypothetical protein
MMPSGLERHAAEINRRAAPYRLAMPQVRRHPMAIYVQGLMVAFCLRLIEHHHEAAAGTQLDIDSLGGIQGHRFRSKRKIPSLSVRD